MSSGRGRLARGREPDRRFGGHHAEEEGREGRKEGRKEQTERQPRGQRLSSLLPLIASLALAALSPGQGNWSMAFNHNDGVSTPSANATNPYAPFQSAPFTGLGITLPFPPSVDLSLPSFNGAHMALIPKGPHRGKILVWNIQPVIATPQPANVLWAFQAFSIIDPAPNAVPRFRNFLLPIEPVQTGPNGPFGSDLFCAGHAWSPFGDLIVVGGTSWSGSLGQFAANLTWVFDPNQTVQPFLASASLYPNDVGLWVQGPSLDNPRYYPTATLTHRLQRFGLTTETMLVLGGSIAVGGPGSVNHTWNSFEALRVVGQPQYFPTPTALVSGLQKDIFGGASTWPGPSIVGAGIDDLFEYPRAHLLTTGHVFISGYPPLSAKEDHENTTWNFASGRTLPAGGWNTIRHYGASVRFPNIGGLNDLIVRIGGADQPPFSGTLGNSTNTVEFCQAAVAGAGWVQTFPLNQSRYLLNAVLLPSASILVLGGAQRTAAGNTNLLTPELFTGNGWANMANAGSPRDYHSTAVLLPDGRVFVGGGNGRTIDYEVFEPPYLAPGNFRPSNVTLPTSTAPSPGTFDAVPLNFADASVEATCNDLPLGVTIQKVVLMAPGSTTHHSDMSQRYHEMAVAPIQPNHVKFTTPANDRVVPRGLYMLFLVTNLGIPSDAVWVLL